MAGYGTIEVTWASQVGADVYELSITDTAPGTPSVTHTVDTNSIMLTGLGASTIKYFQIRAKKTLPSGTVLTSAWSGTVNETSLVVLVDGGTFIGPSAPADPGYEGALWYDSDDGNRLYRWNGSAWVDVQRVLDESDFGLGVRPIQVVGALPTLPDADYPDGSVVSLSTDNYKLYRNNSGTWEKKVATADIEANAITAGLIAAGAITATTVGSNEIITLAANIADAVITNAKIVDLNVAKLVSGTITTAILTMSGTGAQIKSSGYVAGSTGFLIQGNGNAEFNDVTVRGKIRNSQLVVDDTVYLYKSDALTKPAVPNPSLNLDEGDVGGTFVGTNTGNLIFKGRNATGSDVTNRVLDTPTSFTVFLSVVAYDEDASTPSITVDLETSTDGSVWSTVDSITVNLAVVDSGDPTIYEGRGSKSIITSQSITSTGERYFRLKKASGVADFAEATLTVTAQNW